MGVKKTRLIPDTTYSKFEAIDGTHPFKETVPFGCVEYQVRSRGGGRIAFFNFDLAREIGLIPKSHKDLLTPELTQKLLDTFAIQIINEHDMIAKRRFKPETIKPHRYMATRYLQIQHPNKNGVTSGDGRSIWNGVHKYRGKTWDISSCGTGATCLSPATAINKEFYQTGDPSISYGCGYSEISEGIGNAIYSEIISRSGIRSERSLCVIEFPKGLSINVRVGENLIRPSHLFNHLKQNQLERLTPALDYYVEREVANQDLARQPTKFATYDQLLKRWAKDFATVSAQFEANYIFCWMDWDGDNILANGGVIDYGSIRRLGMFHHDYQFDDDSRWSTKLTEQKHKAKYIVQTFAQLLDYVKTGKKKNIQNFSNAKILKYFDQEFERELSHQTLVKIGFGSDTSQWLIENHAKKVLHFQKAYRYFESRITGGRRTRYGDGVSRNAIYSMRDFLREYPERILEQNCNLTHKDFLEMCRSPYMNRKDQKPTRYLEKQLSDLQRTYKTLIETVARRNSCTFTQQTKILQKNALQNNRSDLVTGDGMIHILKKFLSKRKTKNYEDFHEFIMKFVNSQSDSISKEVSKEIKPLLRIAYDHRYSL